MELIKLRPIYKSMIWGGDRLKRIYHFDIPSNTTGEAWVVSAHQNGDCVLETGPFAGMVLSNFYQKHRDLFGKVTSEEFPLLVKFIDAKDNLSVQVHPDDQYAMRSAKSSGKTECWLVLDCDPASEIIIGHDFETKVQMQEAIATQTVQEHLHRFSIKPGDFFFIPAGTIHAICANTMIYEVQQNSDLTYRIDDFGRVDASGKTRQLHLDEALDVTSFPHQVAPIEVMTTKFEQLSITTYMDNEFFLIQKVECQKEARLQVDSEYAIIGCFSGNPVINGMSLLPGEHVLALQDARNLEIRGQCTLIISAPRQALL